MNSGTSIKIEVKLFNEFQQYKPGESNIFQIELNQGACIKDLFEKLKIPLTAEYVILANGRRVDENTLLSNNDTLVVFSPVAGG
ncbi:MAG: MoaD/ThiS family protein [Thermodesulfobacteriota bacterium]